MWRIDRRNFVLCTGANKLTCKPVEEWAGLVRKKKPRPQGIRNTGPSSGSWHCRWLAPDTIQVINNWADGTLITPLPLEENELRKEWLPGDHFVVCYADNLGRVHDVDMVLSAMTILYE